MPVCQRTESALTGLSVMKAFGMYGYAGVGSWPTTEGTLSFGEREPVREKARGQLYRSRSSCSYASNPCWCAVGEPSGMFVIMTRECRLVRSTLHGGVFGWGSR